MRQSDSLNVSVISRDRHDWARKTYPNPRHQLPENSPINMQYQWLVQTPSMMHNHPSGDPTPSRADIDMTRTIIDTAKPLGIAVHDHIIIGKNGFASMKGLLLI